MSRYPDWICRACGDRNGSMPENHIATWHTPECNDEACGWCGNPDASVTEPRDFRYPPAPTMVKP